MTKNDLTRLLLDGRYSEARQLLYSIELSSEELEGLVLEIAYDQANMVIYSFLCYLIWQNETVQLHNLAVMLLTNPLCFIDGAYFSSLHHVRRAIELDPSDVSLKELLLFLHVVPDQVVSREEAVECAHQILAVQPTNKAALDFLSD